MKDTNYSMVPVTKKPPEITIHVVNNNNLRNTNGDGNNDEDPPGCSSCLVVLFCLAIPFILGAAAAAKLIFN